MLGMPSGNRPQFSIAGIPVRVEPAFFVIIVLLGINPYDPSVFSIVSWVVVAFVSILLHELGHAVAFRGYGVQPSVSLHGFGGLTSGRGELSPRQHIVVSLAGPLSALVLLGLPALAIDRAGLMSSADARLVVAQIVWINIGWSLLNLLPVLPLDGGQVCVAVVDLFAPGRGRRAGEVTSVAVAAVLGVVALAYGFLFGAVFAGFLAMMNVRSLSASKTAGLVSELQRSHRALLQHQPGVAQDAAQAVLAERPSGSTLRWTVELLAWSLLWQGDLTGADAVISKYAHAGAPSGCYQAARALAAGQADRGVTTMAWALANEPAGPAKSLGAVAAAGSGQATAVTRELLLMGEPGTQAAALLGQLLEHAGYHDEAREVGRMVAYAPRNLPPMN